MSNQENSHHSEHHITPLPIYFGVFGALIVGTIVTVWVAEYDFGNWNTVIAMLVASIKATFVLLFFMHLKYDNNMNRAIFGSGFFFLVVLLAFSVADIYTRIKGVVSF